MTSRNKPYLAWLRTTFCLICGTPNPEPHHVNRQGQSSIARKTDDRRCINLCRHHHDEAHNSGRTTFAEKYGIDYEAVIERLNQIYQERTT